jgi:hypothetical protein
MESDFGLRPITATALYLFRAPQIVLAFLNNQILVVEGSWPLELSLAV